MLAASEVRVTLSQHSVGVSVDKFGNLVLNFGSCKAQCTCRHERNMKFFLCPAVAVIVGALMLWLAAYKNGERQSRAKNKTRIPHWLPEPPWFLDRLEACDALDSLRRSSTEVRGRGTISSEGIKVQTLVTVEPGLFWQGNLTPFDDETFLQWEYWGKPCSAFCVSISNVYALKEPVHVRQRKASQANISGRCLTADVSLHYHLFSPAVPIVAGDVMFQDIASDVDLSWSDLQIGCEAAVEDAPVLLMPEPLLLLIRAGRLEIVTASYGQPARPQRPPR